MPYDHHKLQSLRGRYSAFGPVKKAASATIGQQSLRVGPRNHDVSNDPESYDFDSWETTRAYFRRNKRTRVRVTLPGKTNRGP